MEARFPPRPHDACTACLLRDKKKSVLGAYDKRYRCDDCLPEPDLCPQCVKTVHTFAPFHRLLRWNADARTWVRSSMSDLEGHALHLGHRGAPCPRPTKPEPDEMVIVHEFGVSSVKVHSCGCTPPFSGWSAQRFAIAPPPLASIQAAIGIHPLGWDAYEEARNPTAAEHGAFSSTR